MNTHKIPEITLTKINNLNKKFLWNASNNTNKKSYISWNMVCRPKNFQFFPPYCPASPDGSNKYINSNLYG